MKTLLSFVASLIVFASSLSSSKADTEFSVDFFYDNLGEYGDWSEVGDYGYCWHPRDVDADWRPYSDGQWVYTDVGWTWTSEEPYSWAVYHYGRWTRVEEVGWVWVPGTEWAPAWVSWRRSPRHVGWAPLPPEARFDVSVGFSSRVDADYDIGPGYYNFVEVRNFGAPRLRSVIVQPRENITIIQQTTNITHVTYQNNVIINGGPQYDVISRESAQPIRRLRLERRQDYADIRTVRGEQLRARVEGDSLQVVAVPVAARQTAAPKRVSAKIQKVNVDRGWKNAGPPAEVEKVRAKIKAEPVTTPALTQTPAETTAPKTDKPTAPETAKTPAPPAEKNDATAAAPVTPAAPAPVGRGGKTKGGKPLPVPAAAPDKAPDSAVTTTPDGTPTAPSQVPAAAKGKGPKGKQKNVPAPAPAANAPEVAPPVQSTPPTSEPSATQPAPKKNRPGNKNESQDPSQLGSPKPRGKAGRQPYSEPALPEARARDAAPSGRPTPDVRPPQNRSRPPELSEAPRKNERPAPSAAPQETARPRPQAAVQAPPQRPETGRPQSRPQAAAPNSAKAPQAPAAQPNGGKGKKKKDGTEEE